MRSVCVINDVVAAGAGPPFAPDGRGLVWLTARRATLTVRAGAPAARR